MTIEKKKWQTFRLTPEFALGYRKPGSWTDGDTLS